MDDEMIRSPRLASTLSVGAYMSSRVIIGGTF